MLLKPHETPDSALHLTQEELMEKFNIAFYEGQNSSSFEETSQDFFIDCLVSPTATLSTSPDDRNFFDYNDFVETFDQNVCPSSTDTGGCFGGVDDDFSQFFVPPPIGDLDLDLSDIEICDGLSEGSIDLDHLTTDLQDLDEKLERQLLPPVATISKSLVDFNCFLRNAPADDLTYTNQGPQERSDFGHLIGAKTSNVDFLSEDPAVYDFPTDNLLVTTQAEALLHDDPLLSAGNLLYPRRKYPSESDSDVSSTSNYRQCQWENCYQIYDGQTALVKHIEKCHVEVKRGDEFTCFWANCPRKVKPFNARYKLLIHMRVHSGEKPNKCPFQGCNKAFSRLENLKIHQRSHTGERPYLCQFPSCTKSFSNSSDRAKHQRTHFDTKPYACQVMGCSKKYTDPSSLRKHVKNHTNEEQMMVKRKNGDDCCFDAAYAKKFLDPNKQKAVKSHYRANLEHNYSNAVVEERKYDSSGIRQDLKNKISEKNRLGKH